MLIARDILEELDEAAGREPAFFPEFEHGYNYHVDGHLSVYGDASRWVIAIEQLEVNPRSGGLGGIHCEIYYHGNSVVLPPQEGWGDHARQISVDNRAGARGAAAGGRILRHH